MARAGDVDEQVEALFRAHYAPLVRGLTLAAGSPEAAADAVQDAFVQLHRHWRKVSGYDEPVAWLRRVAVNRVQDQRRGVRRRDAAVGRLQVLSGSGDAAAAPDLDAVTDLRDAVASLPRGQRLVIGLHHLTGLPVAEVADALEISEGTVKSQLHDARSNLRAALEVRHA
jgi:RNA polymerase sigma-70 factor (ECF subfamily)